MNWILKEYAVVKVQKFVGVAAVAFALLLGGCSTDTGGADAQGEVEEITLPQTELGEMSGWVVEQLNSGDALSEEVWGEKIAPVVTEQMTTGELLTELEDSVKPFGPFEAVSFDEQDGHAVAGLVSESGDRHTLTVSVDAETGQLSGIFFK